MHIILFHFYSKKPNPVYQEISSSLRTRGHKVWVGAPNQDGDLEWHNGEQVIATQPGPERSFMGLWGVKVLRPLLVRLQYFAFMWRVGKFLKKHQPDIAQINTNLSAWVLPLFGSKKIRYILDIRQINEDVSQKLTTRIKEKLLILSRQAYARYFYEHTCFCHEGAAVRILGKNWQRRGTIVPVGVDNQFLHFDANDLAQSKDDEPVKFIYLGTLSPIRNLDRLIYAAKELLGERTDFQLDLVGPDAVNGFYHRVAKELNLGDAVNILPPVPYEAVPDLLSGYDVGLAYIPDRPTWHYQPTIKVLEYRALGLPIISTDVASHREVVQEGVNGLLIKDDVQSIKNAFQQFVVNRPFLHQCRENAVEMRRGLTWLDVAEMYDEKVYQKLVN